MSFTINTDFAISAPQSKKGNAANKTASAAETTKVLGATDELALSSKPKMPKLTPTVYEIKDGDSFQKIANKLGLKVSDLIEQLKDQGKLPKDYDPFVRHTKDVSWMKAGKSINVSYPKTEAQKAAYEIYTENRKFEYYNKKASNEKQD